MNRIIEKKHRLSREEYIGEKVISFTLCIKERNCVFIRKDVFSYVEKTLLNELINFKCESLVHLFMPDHSHLILKGNNEGSDVLKALNMFKQKTGYWFHRNMSKIKWQKDYHDHIIRRSEDLNSHIHYVLNNPVRAELVEHWKQYEFKGSTVHNFDGWPG